MTFDDFKAAVRGDAGAAHGLDEDAALERIREGLAVELESPTDDPAEVT